MPDAPPLKRETLAAQGGGATDRETGGVVPPVRLATTFARRPDYTLPAGYDYARPGNPAFEPAEALLARLEGGGAAMLFASGMAAATAAFTALGPGAHVVAPKAMYWALRQWLLETAPDFGLAVDLVDMTDPGALEAAVRPGQTRLVWTETPANPTWEVTDIAAAAQAAHKAGALLAVDNTVPTPVLTRPIELGADLVMHSATKYLNGHSDAVAGALVAARTDAYWQRIWFLRGKGGAILGPFEAWLVLRGMRTLYLRVARASATAQVLAERFARHPRLEGVRYPGLAGDPGHAVARRQMAGGFGGMLSIEVKGGAAAALRVCSRVRVWARATSLGGVESLIEHRASAEGPGSQAPPGLLRLSCGIEDEGDLARDLDQALG